MRLGLVLAASLIAVCLGTAPARAVPDLERPTYEHTYEVDQEAFARPYGGRSDGPTTYYLFEPRGKDGAAPPDEAPVIVYLHGAAPDPWTAPSPEQVRSQIQHYVGSGFTVVWLLFCESAENPNPVGPRSLKCLDFDKQEDAALLAIEAAFRELRDGSGHLPLSYGDDDEGHRLPEVVFVAHSVGTVMAARLAARFGAKRSACPVRSSEVPAADCLVPAPAGLIFHDPAGYEQKVDIGDIHVDIRKTFPIESGELADMRPDTKLVMFVAQGSACHTNSLSTAPRLLQHVPHDDELALVVPHECMDKVRGVWTDACPSGNFDANTMDESPWLFAPNKYRYYSTHATPGDRQVWWSSEKISPLAWLGYVEPTVDCAREAIEGGAKPRCSGALQLDMGRWLENQGEFAIARKKSTYPQPCP